MRRHTHILALVSILMVPGLTAIGPAALAEDPPRPLDGTGVWMKKAFSPSDGGQCKQVWSCSPAEPVEVTETANERLTFLSDQETTGTCRVTDKSACRSCTAPEPATACSWQITTDAP